ncbi:hypothetical protein B0H11DRAFT_2195644 [Mycena galericulata]|nr:hypothetical protein B0H11DRAFT_2195644 [Mycena galericulata]
MPEPRNASNSTNVLHFRIEHDFQPSAEFGNLTRSIPHLPCFIRVLEYYAPGDNKTAYCTSWYSSVSGFTETELHRITAYFPYHLLRASGTPTWSQAPSQRHRSIGNPRAHPPCFCSAWYKSHANVARHLDAKCNSSNGPAKYGVRFRHPRRRRAILSSSAWVPPRPTNSEASRQSPRRRRAGCRVVRAARCRRAEGGWLGWVRRKTWKTHAEEDREDGENGRRGDRWAEKRRVYCRMRDSEAHIACGVRCLRLSRYTCGESDPRVRFLRDCIMLPG